MATPSSCNSIAPADESARRIRQLLRETEEHGTAVEKSLASVSRSLGHARAANPIPPRTPRPASDAPGVAATPPQPDLPWWSTFSRRKPQPDELRKALQRKGAARVPIPQERVLVDNITRLTERKHALDNEIASIRRDLVLGGKVPAHRVDAEIAHATRTQEAERADLEQQIGRDSLLLTTIRDSLRV